MGRPVKGAGRITRLALLTAIALTIFLVVSAGICASARDRKSVV